jgi:hypothetical protein
MASGNAQPEKESFLLVLFRYGEDQGVEARYTNWDEDYSAYSSEPRMKVVVPKNTGSLDTDDLEIGLPLDAGFVTILTAPTAFSDTYVEVREVTRPLAGGGSFNIKVLFTGKVTEVVRNYEGLSNYAGIFAQTAKARLDFPLMPPTTHQCNWQVFKAPCGANQGIHEIVAEIDSLDGLEATATDPNLAAQAGADDRYWHRGFLEKGGLRIYVREYDGSVDDTKFRLAAVPPDSWIGNSQDIKFVAGCDKTIETCRSRFSQEANFSGIGYAMQPYNPNWESPQ